VGYFALLKLPFAIGLSGFGVNHPSERIVI
jgi:hypothetical protein